MNNGLENLDTKFQFHRYSCIMEVYNYIYQIQIQCLNKAVHLKPKLQQFWQTERILGYMPIT